MSSRPICCCLLIGAELGIPALGQTSSAPAEQPASGTSQATRAGPLPPTSQQDGPDPIPSLGIHVARTTEDIRERILLDRIDQLEKRMSELEARGNSSAAAVAVTAPV